MHQNWSAPFRLFLLFICAGCQRTKGSPESVSCLGQLVKCPRIRSSMCTLSCFYWKHLRVVGLLVWVWFLVLGFFLIIQSTSSKWLKTCFWLGSREHYSRAKCHFCQGRTRKPISLTTSDRLCLYGSLFLCILSLSKPVLSKQKQGCKEIQSFQLWQTLSKW